MFVNNSINDVFLVTIFAQKNATIFDLGPKKARSLTLVFVPRLNDSFAQDLQKICIEKIYIDNPRIERDVS